jgi:ABC-type Na+ efflux pump permease subunit
MRLSQAWIVATKDFAVFRTKRYIIYSIAVVPLIVSFMLPLVTWYASNVGRNGVAISATEITVFLPSFAFFYLFLAGVIPVTIASYTLVGEKVEKSLEPLLATPTTDGEILFGKGIAAFLPPLVSILGGAAIFMGLTDAVTFDKLGYYFFPNTNAAILLFLMVPLAVMMSTEWNVFISSRVSDVRIAQQVGILLALPFVGIYIAGQANLVSLGDTNTLLTISIALLLIDLLFLYIARATFRREAILTKWK